jgi:Organic solute transporter Ostalpha
VIFTAVSRKVDRMNARGTLLIAAGSFSLIAVCLSSWLIRQHQIYMTNFSVQSKIVGIIWMIPIYSVDSFLSLLLPSATLYIDMLRDCYEVRI